MDANARAAKLALARKKLKDHQEKKVVVPSEQDFSCDNHKNEEVSPEFKVCPDLESVPTKNENQLELNLHNNGNNPNSVQAYKDMTDMLISSRRNLEVENVQLQNKYHQLENDYSVATNENLALLKKLSNLEQQLGMVKQQYDLISEELKSKVTNVTDLNLKKDTLTDENTNLQEQLEFTKTMLKAKETENASLHSEVNNLQSKLDVTLLQLQQVSNGAQVREPQESPDTGNSETLLLKISSLEQQLRLMQKERDQLNLHFESYVGELNNQLKTLAVRNEEATKEIDLLSAREASLIEQISNMEIRLQKFNKVEYCTTTDQTKLKDEYELLQQKYQEVQERLQGLNDMYTDLQGRYTESEANNKELTQRMEDKIINVELKENSLETDLTKLNADIASDKIAAQRATEQNRKLKIDLQELEEAFVKLSTDKLELTEKVAAEKFLNRELTIKLADINEKAKDMHTKLMAKDEEMIRLQTSLRDLERSYDTVNKTQENYSNHDLSSQQNGDEHPHECTVSEVNQSDENCMSENNCDSEHICLIENKENTSKIPKEDAMVKLQQRFLKIMDEVADLSDEKHRLEHIILQLQNETDTICEYVALYQQQRSLLKKRDEERSAHIKIFQSECQQLKSQLEELSGIIIRLAKDTELSKYFQSEPWNHDLAKVMDLLSNLKKSSLIDPHRSSSELKDFYPCSCCSGNLIDV